MHLSALCAPVLFYAFGYFAQPTVLFSSHFSGFSGHSSIFALFYAENLCCSLTVLFSGDLLSPPTIYSVFPQRL